MESIPRNAYKSGSKRREKIKPDCALETTDRKSNRIVKQRTKEKFIASKEAKNQKIEIKKKI
jgi:hypothetical protein